MPRFVKERLFGGFADIPGDHNNPECTHVLLTKEEYMRLLQEKAKAEQEKRFAEGEAREKIRMSEQELEYRTAAAEKFAKEKIQQVEQKLDAERSESAYQRSLNENLLRISRERANADRRLRPKKEHTGYVVVSSAEKEISYKDYYGKNKKVMLWETVLQSPYSVDFTEEQARHQMQELFNRGENGRWLISQIGINASTDGGYAHLISDPKTRAELAVRNFLLDKRLRANYRAGYWEIIFLHTKPLSVVPKNMRAR
ncbi:hypothetical protein [Agathobaculum desmolans]|uniref:hypothetical protein n=1 Tax=Agathobaculum desmolans TaxID=39484 RepID=UPI0004E13009|nr:hypothetical protein [Agathobaculum desmolans]